MPRPKPTHWQTPGIAKFLFLIWALGCTISGGVAFAHQQWLGVTAAVAGIVAGFVWLELAMVVFAIHGVLEEIRDQGYQPARRSTPAEHPQPGNRTAAPKKAPADGNEWRLG